MRNRIVAVIVVVSLFVIIPFGASAQTVGGGDLTFRPKGATPVVFSHELHVKSKGLKCTGCHYQVFQMTKGSYKMDMNKLTKGDFCGKCHNGQKSFDVKETKNCAKCHK
jgi:c(7)-type cytochrome triheme protein